MKRSESASCFSWPFVCFAIQSTDAEIDALVYEVYELAEDAITLIEEQ